MIYKPAGTVGNNEQQSQKDKRRERHNAEHPSPGVVTSAREQGIGKESHQDAEHNVELEQRDEPAATGGRGDLRDVDRSDDG